MKKIIYILAIIFFGCNSNVKKTEGKSTNSTLIEQKNISTQIEQVVNEENTFKAKKFEFKNPERPIEDTLILKTNHKNFMISPLGMFKVNDKDSIQLKTNLIVDRAYLYETDELYYVFFTDTDHEGATSWIQKIRKNPLESEYVKQIQGFNLGLPVIYNEFAFVSAIGFVGKINLQAGNYEWKHHNLYDYEKYSFNSFDTVMVNKPNVEYISENYRSKSIDKVIVNNKTGEIKEIIK